MSAKKTDPEGGEKARITEFGEDPEDPIAAELRKLYDEAVSEPLPDHLLRLLDKLAEAENRR